MEEKRWKGRTEITDLFYPFFFFFGCTRGDKKQFVEDKSKFFAGVMSAMSAMINLEIPHINVMSKMDLLPKMKARELER